MSNERCDCGVMFDQEQKDYLDSNYVRKDNCAEHMATQAENQGQSQLKIVAVETQVKFILGGIGLIITMLLPILMSVVSGH